MQATSAFINSKKDQLKEELKQENLSPEQRAQYEKELAQWNSGGLILNAIGAGLAAPTNNLGGILAATASPAISHQIGQYFKGKDAEGSTAHLVAHAVLGAAVAAAGGNDALAGGLAAAGAEATAPIVSKWLYGKDAKDLTADEKATVSAIAGLAGAATGVAVGGSMADVAQGNQAGHTAVNNNFEMPKVIKNIVDNMGITAEVTAAAGIGGNVSITINGDGTATITVGFTTGAAFEGGIGISTSPSARPDGVFVEICAGASAGISGSGCISAPMQKDGKLYISGKGGVGLGAKISETTGYQKTIRIKGGAAQPSSPYNSYYKPIGQVLPPTW
jgi:hypothetical protein